MSFWSKLKKFIRKIFIDYNEIDKICDYKYKMLDNNISQITLEMNNNNNNIKSELSEIKEQQKVIEKELENKIINEINNSILKFRDDFSYTNFELLNIKRDPKYKNILIVGFYGAPNLGDELMLETLLEYIENIPNKKITVLLADNPEYSIDKYKDIRFIHYPKTLYDFNVMAEQYDYIIFGGGAVIDDKQYKKEKSYQYDLGTILIKLSIRAIAFKNKVICIALSASKDILDTEYLEKLKYIIQNSYYFSVRDEYTRKYLSEKLGKECEEKIIKVHDIVFSNKKILKNIEDKHKLKNYKNIGIIAISNDDNLEKIDLIINDIKKYNKNIIINLIPFYDYNNMDIEFYKKIIEKHTDIKINIENFPENMQKTIDFYKKNDIIIGMRYHSILLAYALNIPCVAICYDIHEHYIYKIKYLNEIFNKGQAISYKNLKENDILYKLNETSKDLEKSDTISKIILSQAEEQVTGIINKIF